MNTLRLFTLKDFSIPAGTSWYLADLGEFRGKQELYTQQSPQRLKTLREHQPIRGRIYGVAIGAGLSRSEQRHGTACAERTAKRKRH